MKLFAHTLQWFAALLLAALACTTSGRAAERKPNFLFIYTDDQRWDAMGVVQREQGARARFPWFKSPNMDRLAAGGVRFRNAFATDSLCSPSRAAFLAEYFYESGVNVPTIVGVRTTGGKLVKYPGHPEWTEVFDLTVDPYELKNLAADTSTTAKLSAEFDAQVKAVKYAVPPDADKPPPAAAKAKK